MLPNIVQFPVALLAILRARCVQVSINPQYTARELNLMLRDADAVAIVAFEPLMDTVRAALDGTSIRTVVHMGANGSPLLFDSERVAHVDYAPESVACSDTLSARRANAIRPAAGDVALLQYTGGTTGVAKGAKLTHRNLVANVLQTERLLKEHVVPGGEVIVTAIPLYHIFALTVNCLTFMRLGARNLLVANPRSAELLAEPFIRDRVTVVTGVNTLFNALLALPQLGNGALSSVKLAIGGGSAIHRAVSERWKSASGTHIVEGYGLSETSPVATLNRIDGSAFTGGIGYAVPGTEVVIRRADGLVAECGEAGEICIRGPQVMAGYWRRPAETRAAFTADGFFRTGDIGTIDAGGLCRLEDRLKDMILVSGFNVYPNEIEGVLSQLPGIFESAVVGMPDEKTGEAVKAFIVRQNENLSEDQVRAFCRQNLAPYKVPKAIVFVSVLPKSPVGKILRRELRT